MSDFQKFNKMLQDRVNELAQLGQLFVVDVDKDKLYAHYLDSFPAGTNNVFRERREYDCSCCRQYIKNIGVVVAVVDNKLTSIWDIEAPSYYADVCKAMNKFVTKHSIADVYLPYERFVGTAHNIEMIAGTAKKWDHFHAQLPKEIKSCNKKDVATHLGDYRTSKAVFERSIREIDLESVDIVLDLIGQNALYRGAENKGVVEAFKKLKTEFPKVAVKNQNNWLWRNSFGAGAVARIRNTAIGTLLTDLSDGVELETAVKGFEQKVAPTNYKRSTALVTQSMVKNAQKKIEELGYEQALYRRYAVAKDLTINNVIFADRSVKPAMNVFDELASELTSKKPDMKRVDEISIDRFISEIVPNASAIELFVENRLAPNFMSLIAPVHPDGNLMLKWDNNFSWSYAGEVTDSIKERVKSAGGNVDGFLRVSLSWYNHDDLDIHVIEPNKNKIYFGNKRSTTSGVLDVDMNAGAGTTNEPVENIVYTDRNQTLEGTYTVLVNNIRKRKTSDVGFEVELEFDGQVYNFVYPKAVRDNETITAIEFTYSKKNGVVINGSRSLTSSKASKEIWGINTENYHKVTMVMNSPNHWDDNEVGNKHLFFILDKCINEQPARGFYNEFLSNDLNAHRKVFELLGSKMKTEADVNQLSGVGFSSTQPNHALFRVSGKFNRIVKVTF